MNTLAILIKRNTKMFFRDKGMVFTALITPVILLILYATFLSNVYRDSFSQSIPIGIPISDELLDSFVASQLISSLLAVSCVTVAFCTNMLSVQDKAHGTFRDMQISPISPYKLALGYYFSSFISTILVCLTTAAICFIYMAVIGWYLTAVDVLLIIADVFLLTLFGVALSSVINFFLSTQGQISAVGSIVSAGYGFICGAYMPIASFSDWLKNAIMFLPGTHATSLIRNHSMRGVLSAMQEEGLPSDVTEALRDVVDCNIYFFDNKVDMGISYAVLAGGCIFFIAIYVILHNFSKKRAK